MTDKWQGSFLQMHSLKDAQIQKIHFVCFGVVEAELI